MVDKPIGRTIVFLCPMCKGTEHYKVELVRQLRMRYKNAERTKHPNPSEVIILRCKFCRARIIPQLTLGKRERYVTGSVVK